MKLLLTSAGLKNKSLQNALKDLVNEKEIRIAFIPTAANLEDPDKDWLITDFVNCKKLGLVDIVDISAIPKSIWLPKLQWANVIVVGGGDTVYLIESIIKSGLDKELPSLLKNRIYVGISAGSIVTGKKISGSSTFLFDGETKNAPLGLNFVDFYIRPHFNSPYFPKVIDSNLKKLSKEFDGSLYALDDDSALQYIDGKITIISEGTWKKY
ncbi:MAG: Type 1 glutamine amidotransferase-like domain-containing protein [Candidatus Pacearchaeota archaeon]